MIKRVPIIERVPIILQNRVPIIIRRPIMSSKSSTNRVRKINFNAKKYEGLTDSQKQELLTIAHLGQSAIDKKLERFRDILSLRFTVEETDCLENFIPYYNNLVCKATGALYHNSLNNSQYKKRSRYWKSFWRTYNLCKENGWDYKIYLESQFESVSNWESEKAKYPLPNMLYSDRAIAAYEAYVYRNEKSYQREGHNIRVVSKNVGTFEEESKKKIESSVEILCKDMIYYLKHMPELFINSKNIRVACKSKVIMDRWSDFSDEYLATLDGFMSYIGDKSEYIDALQVRLNNIDSIRRCEQKTRILKTIARAAEKSLKVPTSTDFTVEPISVQELW